MVFELLLTSHSPSRVQSIPRQSKFPLSPANLSSLASQSFRAGDRLMLVLFRRISPATFLTSADSAALIRTCHTRHYGHKTSGLAIRLFSHRHSKQRNGPRGSC